VLDQRKLFRVKNTVRIAILGTRGIPANYGGFETFAEEISKRLVARGHEVTVYCRDRRPERWFTESLLGRVRLRVIPTIFHKYLETIFHTMLSFIDCSSAETDVILLCNAANSPFIPIANIKGIPVAVNVDGVERKRAKWNSLGKCWYRLGEWSSVLFAKKIIADANIISDYYLKSYGAKSTIIAYGADRIFQAAGELHSEFALTAKRYFLYVSRLEPENNALGVIEAYVKSGVTMPLVVVGDAPYALLYKESLQKAAANISSEASAQGARVIFAGFQFGKAYRELREHCYLYIQATEVGGTHPALVEAMVHANCIIANDVIEHREVLKDCGLYYPYNNFDALAGIFRELFKNPQLVTEFGEKASTRAQKVYTWEIITKKYEELLLDLTK
jgi:glycosyltransferase involved in cell wall biosynthesis